MPYHGKVSKGCERCRQRKVKCDQRKPSCSRCEKAKAQCPGYRNLADVLFRDDTERIMRRARILNGDVDVSQTASLSEPFLSSWHWPPLTPMSRPLSQPIIELAANFFFAKYYACDGPPGPDGSQLWLVRAYSELPPSHALRAVIEAAGMAGISNVHHAPSLDTRSKQQYGRALEALKHSLSDPREAVADTTLMTVNLFALFEFITFDDCDGTRAWATHLAGATTLLKLRGQGQFDSERGGQLFLQLRSQILYACMQHDVPVSPELRQLSNMFDASEMGRRRKESRPGPLRSFVFRLVNLRDAIRCQELTDRRLIHQTAAEIDRDLVAWAAYLPTYATVDVPADGSPGAYFRGKQHIYGNLTVAQSWNNLRTMRIVINRMMITQSEDCSDRVDRVSGSSALSTIKQLSQDICMSAALSTIKELSEDICMSAATFAGSPHILGIIYPLSVVAQEPANTPATRRWAVEQLHAIKESMGFRQAGLPAQTISRELDTPRKHEADIR